MASQGNYLYTPKNGGATISTANANRDGTGTLGTIVTGATRDTSANPPRLGGSRIDALAIQAQGTTTAGMVRLYVSGGGTDRLIAEVPVEPVTPGANTRAWQVRLNQTTCDFLPIILGSGEVLKASTEKAEAFNVVPLMAGDF
jgi:hypothetical protein